MILKLNHYHMYVMELQICISSSGQRLLKLFVMAKSLFILYQDHGRLEHILPSLESSCFITVY